MMATTIQQPTLTADQAKSALSDVLAAFTIPENVTRMDEARDNAGNDMMKMMQMVFPIATQIQMEVVQKYGFTGNGDGVVSFAQNIRALEKDDTEISRLNAEIKSVFLPQMAAPPPPLKPSLGN